MRKFAVLLLILAIIGAFHPLTAKAQQHRNTITVLPQLTRVDLSIDKPETEIYYTNNAVFPVELALSVEDVRELEDRNPVGILDPKEAANYKYSLSSWVYLDKQSLVLNPGETKAVKVTINKDKLSPGGHYGSVLAEIKQSDTINKAVKIKGVLVSLLFVRASTGNEVEEAKIASFGQSSGIAFPDEYVFRFQNTGNVDLTPYGLVEVLDGNNKLLAKGVVNEDSLTTLPEAIRKYTVSITKTQPIILPGKYTARLTLHFGKDNKKLTATSTFVTLGSNNLVKWVIITAIASLLIVVILAIVVRKRMKKITR